MFVASGDKKPVLRLGKNFLTPKFTRRTFRFRIVTLIPVLTWHLHSLTLDESSF